MCDLIIRMRHVRKAKLCSRGARSFFELNDLDFYDFLKNGISSDKLIATGDSMALSVVKVAEKENASEDDKQFSK